MDTPLSAQLEAALLRALGAAWHDHNHGFFGGRLVPPTIALSDSATRLGEWQRATRTLTLSRPLVIGAGWGAVLEVLKHEMAHQFVAEALGEPDATAHGPAFRALCERLGIDGRAAGIPSPSGPTDGETRVLARIAKLLALAESANVHEAELAMAAAQRLMLKHNLETAPRSGYGFRHLGVPTGRVSESERLLASLLGEHFFVECIWVPVWRPLAGKRGSVLEVCGTAVNLAMAEHVHGFLTQTADRLFAEYQRAANERSRRDRPTFLAGVMMGFREQLEAQRKRHTAEGLVWVGDADLAGYYRRRHPHIRMTRHSGNRRTDAHEHGRAAGRELVLRRPLTPPSVSRGRLLPS